jgi:hypothetical protein
VLDNLELQESRKTLLGSNRPSLAHGQWFRFEVSKEGYAKSSKNEILLFWLTPLNIVEM